MINLLKKFVVTSGIGLTSVLAFILPANASVFYDLKFFDESGELVGTGEFSHEEEPFEGTIDLCQGTFKSVCGYIPVRIQKEDYFFRVDSFSSTVGLNFYSSPNHNQTLFWRPFDDELVASITPCQNHSCQAISLLYNNDSWYDGIQHRAIINIVHKMTATEWISSVGGWTLPAEIRRNASGTWTATRQTSIPEPASTLGLIALGVFAVGSKLKRNSH